MPDKVHYCASCMTELTAGQCMQCSWSDERQAETHSHLPLHSILVDRYYIGRALGEGGFGVTYLARDLLLDRVVAVKEYLPVAHCARLTDRVTVRPHDKEKGDHYHHGLEGFLREAKALAKLDGHPNIVSITDYTRANGTAYLAMSYIDGLTLTRHLASRGGRLPYKTAVDIMLHVMSALRAMHSYGLLHRDISPGNIMITRQGQVKVVDFGAARYAIGESDLSTILKPGYSPEEQFRTQGRQGTWTDVYATGATLYHCVTGTRPSSAVDRLAEDDLLKPSALAPGVPPLLDQAIMKAMAVKAADRFQTIDEFETALLTKESAEAKKEADRPVQTATTNRAMLNPTAVAPERVDLAEMVQRRRPALAYRRPLAAAAAIVFLAIAGFFFVRHTWPTHEPTNAIQKAAPSSIQPTAPATLVAPLKGVPGRSGGLKTPAVNQKQDSKPLNSDGLGNGKGFTRRQLPTKPSVENAEDCCADSKDLLACNKARKAEGLGPCFINRN